MAIAFFVLDQVVEQPVWVFLQGFIDYLFVLQKLGLARVGID